MIAQDADRKLDLADPALPRPPVLPRTSRGSLQDNSLTENAHWSFRSLRLGDYLIVVLLLLVTVGWITFGVGPAKAGSFAEVQVRGKQVAHIKLDREDYYTINGALGPVLIAVDGAGIRILDARCPDKLCVKTGAINHAGEWIACVPNRLVIRIDGYSGVDAISPGAAMP